MLVTPLKRILIILLAFSSVLMPQTTAIAVIDFEGKGVSQIEASALTDRLRSEVMNMTGAIMVEREQMDQILREQDFQQTGCVSSECLVEVGQLIGVTQIIGGSISKIGNTFSVNARIIDVETGKIDNSVIYDLTGVIDELLISGMRNVSQLLFAGAEGDYLELGKDYEYYESGKVKAEGRSINGVKLGRWIYYYENGRIQRVGNFKDGKKIGEWTTYNQGGGIEQVDDYTIATEVSQFAYYDDDGEIFSIAEIIPSKLSNKITKRSHVIEYYQSGAKKAEYDRRRDLVSGERIAFSIDGSILSKYTFLAGKGIYIDYYPNGKIKHYGYCIDYTGIDMKKIGPWKHYTEKGVLLFENKYDNNGALVEVKQY